jgi:hypothetical protein
MMAPYRLDDDWPRIISQRLGKPPKFLEQLASKLCIGTDPQSQELYPLRTTESLTRVSQCVVQSLQRFRLDLTNSLASKP